MQLTDLPNVGPVLADNLRRVGLETPEALRDTGTYAAFLRIRTQVDDGACLHLLQALEGAVEGIPKKTLSPEKKQELLTFFRGLSKAPNQE